MTQQNDLREFLLILRQSLLMIVRWIERKYLDTASQTPVVPFSGETSTKK